MNERYAHMFAQLKERGEGAFIPFVMLGDPTLDVCQKAMDVLVQSGADALELGIPFSDPVADGAVIQRAGVRALSAGVTPDDCFALIKRLRARYPHLPIGLLVYANIVIHRGLEDFYQRAYDSGADSVLIADLSIKESAPFIAAAQKAKIAPVFVAPPNADDDTLSHVARLSQGYVYFLGRVGVTGADRAMQMPASPKLQTLRDHHSAPIVIGFGISTPEHVKTAMAAGADGAISGSAIVKIMEEHLSDANAMSQALAAFVRSMKAATKS
ncbi:MAG: tryptophan synthase subunit alpha [Burkholderiales bacterium]|nr:tryptophan synthase subunit alpha [Burkholderiales bacterium]